MRDENLVERIEGPTVARDLLEARWSALWAALRSEGLDALLIASRGALNAYGNLFYVSGFPLFLTHGYALLRDGEPPQVLLGRREQALADVYGAADLVVRSELDDVRYGLGDYSDLIRFVAELIDAHGLRRGRIGVVGMNDLMPLRDVEGLRALQPEAVLEDAGPMYAQVKAIKSEAELVLLDEAAALADDGFEVFLDRVAVGRTEAELVAAVEQTVRSRGALPYTIIDVLPGQAYTRPAIVRPLRSGETFCCFVEIVAPNGFWVEKGAMFSLGTPPDRALEVYEASERAYAAAERELRAGRRASDVARAIANVAREAGCQLGIQSGHGVGVDHDVPLLTTDDHTVLEPGMAIALHPHLHDADFGGLAIDGYTITDGEPIRHSRFERRLYQV